MQPPLYPISMQLIEYIGFAAMVVTAISLVPQVVKSYLTKSTKDISIFFNSIYLCGMVLWFIYGVGISSVPLMIAPSVEFLLALSMIILKVRYG